MIFKAIFGVIIAVGGYFIFTGIQNILDPAEVFPPNLSEDIWWGARKPETVKDDSIRPFTISFPDNVIQHLKKRLTDVKFPNPPLKDVNFEYGFNLDYLKKIRSHWLNSYDWNARLKFLNSLPHFKTVVSGLDIHFIHAKPDMSAKKSLKVFPILLLHGWPGSVREFYELIPQLVTPRKNSDFVFEVVAPSLPGYGFSEGAAIQGLMSAHIGVIFKKLMYKLGHKKFYVHGGDWGAIIGRDISILYPDSVLGFHSTMCASDRHGNLLIGLGSLWPELIVDKEHEHRLYPLSNYIKYAWLEFGYMHLQATKPDTIGTALLDSPIGLAAYILEKFSTWTNPSFRSLPDGGLTKKYSLDALLDNVMIYWTTDSILTSMRIYSEVLSDNYQKLTFNDCFIKVPTVCALFPHEILYSPPTLLKRVYKNLVKAEHFPEGGHFAAFELPNVIATDLWTSVPLFIEARENATRGATQ